MRVFFVLGLMNQMYVPFEESTANTGASGPGNKIGVMNEVEGKKRKRRERRSGEFMHLEIFFSFLNFRWVPAQVLACAVVGSSCWSGSRLR